MPMMEMTEAGVDSKISSFTKNGLVQVPLYALGFIFGATEGNATFNVANGNAGYVTNLPWRVKDTLTNLGIGGITANSSSGGSRSTPCSTMNGDT